MTSMTVVEGSGWGEARERARTRRRYRVAGVVIAAVALVSLGQPALRGWVDGIPGVGDRAPAVTGAIAGALISLLATIGGLVVWSRLDEVQRRRATNSWAIAGLAAYLVYPVAQQAVPLLGAAEPGRIVWLFTAAVAVGAQLWQRWRG